MASEIRQTNRKGCHKKGQKGFTIVCLATITKYHSLGGLNNGNLFFPGLQTEKCKIKVPEWQASDESPLSGLQMAAFPQCFPWRKEMERELSAVSYYKSTDPITDPSSQPCLNLIIAQRPHFQISLPWS